VIVNIVCRIISYSNICNDMGDCNMASVCHEESGKCQVMSVMNLVAVV